MEVEVVPKRVKEMGCTTSGPVSTDIPGTALNLANSKLKFSLKQLKCLNKKMETMVAENDTEFLSEQAETVAERLVQSILCGAASKDPRFKSKYLVVLHRDRIIKSKSLEYLILLDELETGCAVAEGPPGCARLKPTDEKVNTWKEYLTPSGFLRRDKIIERWVEVLAQAAAEVNSGGSFEEVAPGFVVSQTTLQKLKNMLPDETCFYANPASEEEDFPRPRDYRIAIVEGSPWVRVRIAGGTLSPEGVLTGIEAKLALGVAYDGWPAGCDLPSRVPLGHPDALLFYKAAHTGFFVVAGAPGPGVQWSERAAGWQVWPGGARSLLSQRGEGFSRVALGATSLLNHLRTHGKPCLRVVSRFHMEEALLWRIEQPANKGPAGDLKSWTATHLAHHLICVLDTILGQLISRSGRHYLFPGCDMTRLAVWKGSRIADRDWKGDADCIMGFLESLHQNSDEVNDENSNIVSGERLENAICSRWSSVVQEGTPAGSTRGRRLAGAPPYSPRQLAYVAIAARMMLTARRLVIQDSSEWFLGGLSTTVVQHSDPIEDLIHLLAVIMDQARDYYLRTHLPDGIFTKPINIPGLGNASPTGSRSKDTLKKHKMKNCYDASAAYLIDAIRRDPETQSDDLTDDNVLVRTMLRWLYKAVDDDKKYLGPVLKPYLELLFATSNENCWHLDLFRERTCSKELNALSSYCKMVVNESLDPAVGLVDAATKGWKWAENMLEVLEVVAESGGVLTLIFFKSSGTPVKFDLSLPENTNWRESLRGLHVTKQERLNAKLKMAEQCVMEAFAFSLEQEFNFYPGLNTKLENDDDASDGTCDETLDNVSKTQTLKSTTETVDTTDERCDSKYHTLRSTASKYSTLRNSEQLFGSSWSTGDTWKLKNGVSKTSILDYVNDSKLNGDGSRSIHCLLRDSSPITLILQDQEQLSPNRENGGIVRALITMQKYTVLQDLCGWISGKEERSAALKALYRLARGGRRNNGISIIKVTPSLNRNNYVLSPKKTNFNQKYRASIRQYYRRRNIDAMSGDEGGGKRSNKRTTATSLDTVDGVNGESSLPQTREDILDYEIQQEYLKDKSLQDLHSFRTELDDRYLQLCRDAIRDSNLKRSNAAILEFNKDLKEKLKITRKEAKRSSSMGKNSGVESFLKIRERYGMAATLGRSSGRETKMTSSSLLGTCREARLHHAAGRTSLNKAGTAADDFFGDAFRISPLYSGVQSEYEMMTQSILQSNNSTDRQRHLLPNREKRYP